MVRHVVDLLAARDYPALERLSRGVRLSAAELAEAVREYGVTLLPLPRDSNAAVDFVRIRDAVPDEWSVVVRLYSREEGPSDLSLELTLRSDGHGGFSVELDDLHVP